MSIQPIGPPQNAILGEATLNGVKIHVLFDTGASQSVLTLHGARRAGVRTDGPGVTAASAAGGIGRRLVSSWIAPFDTFEIGGETVKTTRITVADVEMGDNDMSIGADFFLAHRIYVARSQDKLYFTYNGGPVFNLGQFASGPAPAPLPDATQASADPVSDQPTTAAGFALRAAASVSRHEYPQAIADYGRAIELEPNDPKHYYDRGVARVLNGQPILSMDDFDQALKLKPDDVAALMMRAELRMASRDQAGARTDFESAAAIDPEMRLRVAAAYAGADLFGAAVDSYDRWISSHPKNEDAARAYGGRCFTRALWGHDLDKALADCNQALDLIPNLPQALAGRGLVRIRQGDYDRAIADDNAAIKLQPKAPWALYGRGLAKLRKGQKDEGAADIAAAVAVAPKLPDRAKLYGLAPDS
jgi:tetratricopeptide (TPR) repeat protein